MLLLNKMHFNIFSPEHVIELKYKYHYLIIKLKLLI